MWLVWFNTNINAIKVSTNKGQQFISNECITEVNLLDLGGSFGTRRASLSLLIVKSVTGGRLDRSTKEGEMLMKTSDTGK